MQDNRIFFKRLKVLFMLVFLKVMTRCFLKFKVVNLKRYIFKRQMKLVLILTAILVVLHAEVIPFDNSAVEKVFEKRQPALFLFIGD
jgi:diacylglycerol kinase